LVNKIWENVLDLYLFLSTFSDIRWPLKIKTRNSENLAYLLGEKGIIPLPKKEGRCAEKREGEKT
jgi:hypothetical protein